MQVVLTVLQLQPHAGAEEHPEALHGMDGMPCSWRSVLTRLKLHSASFGMQLTAVAADATTTCGHKHEATPPGHDPCLYRRQICQGVQACIISL